MVTTEQIKALEERQQALYTHLHIEDRRLELDEQEALTHDPNFWDDPAKAEAQLKKVAGIKYWITAYDAIASAMEELHLLPEFIREGASSPEELDTQYNKVLKMIEELEMRNMLRSEEDHLGAIMEINSGAGGTESLDWAAMLMRMYMRWGEANGYQVKVIDVQDGEEVGIKSATLEFVGEFAYGYLKSESGVHSPPTTNAKLHSPPYSFHPPLTIPSKSLLTPPTSNGIPTEAAVRADKMSTRSKPVSAYATCLPVSWSRIPRPAPKV